VWELYQFPKSILMPKRLHGALKSFYHRLKRSSHPPADYEFPTSVWRTRKILAKLGFREIEIVPQHAYPERLPRRVQALHNPRPERARSPLP
jgi:hypothetical protein